MQLGDAAADFFTEEKGIDLKTELNRLQVVTYAKALWFAREFEVPELEDFVMQLMRNMVSLDRKSRREFAHIWTAKAARTHTVEEKKVP